MKKIFQLLLLLSIGLFLNSCYYDSHPIYEEIDNGEGGGGEEIPNVVSFATDIQPLFTKCIGCHASNISPDLRTGNSYNALVPKYVIANNANSSRLYNYLPGNGHHDVGISYNTTEIALIKAWIDQGAKNN